MRRGLYFTALFLLCMSCSEDYNTRLRGQWQLRNIITSEGEVSQANPVYYSFDSHVFQIKSNGTAYAEFRQEGDSLYILFEDSTQIKSLQANRFWGWRSTKRSFRVTELNFMRLRLKDAQGEMVFRRY